MPFDACPKTLNRRFSGQAEMLPQEERSLAKRVEDSVKSKWLLAKDFFV